MRFNVRPLNKIEEKIHSLSLTEKTIFWFFVVVLGISTLAMLNNINKQFLVEIPAKGGSLTEGAIGSPRFINPLLAISNADRDLTTLVYSGLLKSDPSGELIPDLAESYTISDDGLTYTFKLKDDIFFHDKTPITTKDVEFTIKLTQDSIIKSPKRPNWDGVKVNVVDDKEIQFILTTPYSPFLENTTLGILPKHIWENIAPEQFAFSEFNIEPIGSGPYQIKKIKKDSSGIIEKYDLKAFKNYSLGEPYITNITINFYPNEDALINAYEKGNVESINTVSPEKAKLLQEVGARIEDIPLPRIFGVFFNQNQNSIFSNIEVRKALNLALDKQKIVDGILSGYGIAINNPVPPTSMYYDQNTNSNVFDQEEAVAMLERNGWKINEETGVREKEIKKTKTPLVFSISTSDTPELKAVAEMIKEDWEKIGAKVDIKVFEIGDLNQNIIRPREYDALLFGEVIGRDMDLYAFWHSSQRNDPGLNIAMYANITTDKILEDVRKTTDIEKKKDLYTKFQKEIANDVPAVFVYSPDFIYVVPKKINNLSLGQITMPSERFLNIYKWNIDTDTVWKIFK